MIRTLKNTCLAVVFTSAPFFAHFALGEDLKDFNEASTKNGCDSIPYSTQRGNCRSKQGDVESWCKSSDRKRSCEGGQFGIKQFNENIERMAKKKDELASQKSSAASDDAKREIDAKIAQLSNEIESHKRRIDDTKREIGVRIDNGEHCRDYRKQVQEEFGEAIRKASSESDPEIKKVAAKLIQYWKDSGLSHDNEIDNVVKVIEYCKDRLNQKE